MAQTRFILFQRSLETTCGIGIEIVAYLLCSPIYFSQKARSTNFPLWTRLVRVSSRACILFFYFSAVRMQCLIVISYPSAPSRNAQQYLVIRCIERSYVSLKKKKKLATFSTKRQRESLTFINRTLCDTLSLAIR